MFKTIYWYLHFMFTALLSLPQLSKGSRLHKEGKFAECDAFTHTITSDWARKQVKCSGATILVHGEEHLPKDTAVVFISNHQGNFDIALFMGYINKPKGYVSKIEISKLPVLNTWMKYMHCVFMDRSTLKGAATAIIEGVKTVKEGHSLVIFPEGTRSRSNHIGEFKGGSFKLATKAKAPIIPVTINGSYKLMEDNGGKVKADTVEVFIHPPILTAALSKEEIQNLPETVRHIIASKLPNQGK